MSVKRRDSKNRVLRNGESQRKDGRYAYTYVDSHGKQKFIYSWKLEKTDSLPKGKRDCIALREKIKQIQKDLEDGIVSGGNNMTVLSLVEKYVGQKNGVRDATKYMYNYVLQILRKDLFGAKHIDKVKLLDAKEWIMRLQEEGRSYGTIKSIRSVVRPAFQMAVENDLLRKNPFNFSVTTVLIDDSSTREGITEKQEKDFLEFVRNVTYYKKYYDAIYVLFNTGLRISEFAGLTISDIDFVNSRIRIDHQLLRRNIGSGTKLIIAAPKSISGIRYVPMTDEVSACFKQIIENRKKCNNETVIDGKQGFLFLSKNGIPLDARVWEGCFSRICKKYNEVHEKPIPKVTPHVCRHTFCSRMVKKGMNPKALQYIMGHSDISLTLNRYTHLKYEDAEREMAKVCNCN